MGPVFSCLNPTVNALGPHAVSDSGKPSAEAKRFLDETTAADRPRVYRNAVVLAVPSRDGLEAARTRIREWLGWEDVRSQPQIREQNLEDTDPIRWQTLLSNVEESRKKIPEAIQQAYCIVVTVSDKNDMQAFKVTISGEPLFTTIKNDKRARIQETAITADAVLPGGPYDLWRDDETARRVKDLVGAFAQFPHLPKMLNAKAILDTLVDGCRNGLFVLRLQRPDRSVRTWWREAPDDTALKDPGLEVVLPEAATLTNLAPALLLPQILPGLWEQAEITFADLCAYFSGGRVIKIPREGYEEPVTIPKVERTIIEAAVQAAVQDGTLWLTSGPASIFAEEIPAGLLTDDAKLQAPPPPISALEISPDNLPEAWNDGATTALAITVALSKKAGKTLPWAAVQKAIDGASRARLLERTPDSSAWPCDFAGAATIRLRVPQEELTPRVFEKEEPPRKPGVLVAAADLQISQIQDLAEHVAELAKLAVGFDLKFHLQVEFGGASRPPDDIVAAVNSLLSEISDALALK